MIKTRVISQPGFYHNNNNTPIEDHYSLKQNDSVSVAVLCDGAGAVQFGANAAKIVSKLLSKYVFEKFDRIFDSLPDIILREITQLIDRELIEYSKKRSIDIHELACTIMACAMDCNGRCICFHLGDGIILRKNISDTEYEIVSSPQNGITENSTYLTMNCSIAEKMRFYRWQDADILELILMTDGAYSCVFENHQGTRRYILKNSSLIKGVSRRYRNAADDCSCIVIQRI